MPSPAASPAPALVTPAAAQASLTTGTPTSASGFAPGTSAALAGASDLPSGAGERATTPTATSGSGSGPASVGASGGSSKWQAAFASAKAAVSSAAGTLRMGDSTNALGAPPPSPSLANGSGGAGASDAATATGMTKHASISAPSNGGGAALASTVGATTAGSGLWSISVAQVDDDDEDDANPLNAGAANGEQKRELLQRSASSSKKANDVSSEKSSKEKGKEPKMQKKKKSRRSSAWNAISSGLFSPSFSSASKQSAASASASSPTAAAAASGARGAGTAAASASTASQSEGGTTYTLYVSTPTHNLTLTRTAAQIVQLDRKLRAALVSEQDGAKGAAGPLPPLPTLYTGAQSSADSASKPPMTAGHTPSSTQQQQPQSQATSSRKLLQTISRTLSPSGNKGRSNSRDTAASPTTSSSSATANATATAAGSTTGGPTLLAPAGLHAAVLSLGSSSSEDVSTPNERTAGSSNAAILEDMVRTASPSGKELPLPPLPSQSSTSLNEQSAAEPAVLTPSTTHNVDRDIARVASPPLPYTPFGKSATSVADTSSAPGTPSAATAAAAATSAGAGKGYLGTTGQAPSTTTLIATYLTTLSNLPAVKRQSAWKRFVRVEADDLQSVRVERRIKKVRSDLAQHVKSNVAPKNINITPQLQLDHHLDRQYRYHHNPSRDTTTAGASQSDFGDDAGGRTTDDERNSVISGRSRDASAGPHAAGSAVSSVEAFHAGASSEALPRRPTIGRNSGSSDGRGRSLPAAADAPNRSSSSISTDARSPNLNGSSSGAASVAGSQPVASRSFVSIPEEREQEKQANAEERKGEADGDDEASTLAEHGDGDDSRNIVISAASTSAGDAAGSASRSGTDGKGENSASRKKKDRVKEHRSGSKRASSAKVTVEDFEMIRVLGKGCAGKVSGKFARGFPLTTA